MIKYHKQIYFNNADIQKINNRLEYLNIINFKYSLHSKQKIMQYGNIENIIDFLNDYKINIDDIFEYKKIDDDIIQIAVRLKFNDDKDLILVISLDNKNIITIWFNNNIDKHYTLNKREYSLI